MEAKLTWPDDPPTTTRRMRFLAEAAVEFFDVQFDDLKSRKRTNELVWPRSICMWIARDAGYSSPAIAKWWGKDHSTILYAAKLVDDLRKKPSYDKQFRQFVLFTKNYIRRVEKK